MIKRIVVAVCTVVIGGLFLIFGADISAGIRSGISVCGEVVIPSLFPFMILAEFVALSGASDTLSKPISPFTRWLFGLPKVTAAPILLSFISGYPVGASLARRLYDSGKISRSDAEKMLTFTVNSSPAMLIFAVGMGMLGGKEYGYLLYIVHILASVLNGILFSRIILNSGANRRVEKVNLPTFNAQNTIQTIGQKSAYGITKKDDTPHYNIADAFVTATADASVSMLKICGCVILFAGIVASIKSARILALILEVTVGCKVAVNYGIKAISAVVGFGGISVIMQVMTVSKGLIRPWILILSRITHAAISYGLCSVAISLLPEKTVAVLSTGLPQLDSFTSVTAPASAAMLLLAVVVMFSAKIANAR
ncbi:MAG: hypothetical protein II257_03560 [Clostridia bacterium]|nr:hypothetical protein [Clostridia bacterium]